MEKGVPDSSVDGHIRAFNECRKVQLKKRKMPRLKRQDRLSNEMKNKDLSSICANNINHFNERLEML